MDDQTKDALANLNSRAIEYGKSFNKNLDYSISSIKDIEEILEYYSKDLNETPQDEKPTFNQLMSMASIWGAYIGEIIKRIHTDFEWTFEEFMGSRTLHLKAGNNRIFPLDKTYKRIVNGIEDSIISYIDYVEKDYL